MTSSVENIGNEPMPYRSRLATYSDVVSKILGLVGRIVAVGHIDQENSAIVTDLRV
jgi:hypothetical protein